MKLAPILLTALLATALTLPAIAQDKPQELPPTHANVSYGSHASNVMDIWIAEGQGPRPLLVYIHGGGWIGGTKNRGAADNVQPFLDKGVSYAAVEYRLTGVAPLPAPVHDAARAIQFIRSKAKEWNINPDRIALTGGSAGACTSMWILCHDDLADLDSRRPCAPPVNSSNGCRRGGWSNVDRSESD